MFTSLHFFSSSLTSDRGGCRFETVTASLLSLTEMALLAFSVLALAIGHDIRRLGWEALVAGHEDMRITGQDAIVIGAWVSFLGAISLNVAIWRLF